MALDDIMGRREYFQEYDIIMRVYCWQKPTLSCGFHQKPERRLSWESCRRHGIDLVWRPTGGRELLHDGDLSFCLAGKRKNVNGDAYSEARAFFYQAGEIIAGGLQSLGIEAKVKTGNLKTKGIASAPCLAAVSQYEIVSSGKKIVPMAQRIYPEAIIVHGSIPLRDSSISTAELLKETEKARISMAIEQASTSVFKILGKAGDPDLLKRGFKKTFENILKISAESRSIPKDMLAKADEESKKWEIEINKQTCRN